MSAWRQKSAPRSRPGAAIAHCSTSNLLLGSGLFDTDSDVVVLDFKSTPLIDYRVQFADTLDEALMLQLILADDRAIRATYIAGHCAYRRER